MTITDHVAILTYSALAQAVPNQKKAGKPLHYFAVVAFPPSAQSDIAAVLTAVAPGGQLAGLDIRVPRNSQTSKPIPGVPGDWFVIRTASQFPPYLADESGKQLSQDTEQAAIRTKFYPGKRVRVAMSAYLWSYQGTNGLSFNLNGVMAVADNGERLAIGNTAANDFAAYADPAAAAAGQTNPFAGAPSSSTTQTAPSGSSAAVAANADPFQQQANRAQGANPFA